MQDEIEENILDGRKDRYDMKEEKMSIGEDRREENDRLEQNKT